MKFAWTEKDKERFFKRAERQLKAAGIDFVQVDREQICYGWREAAKVIEEYLLKADNDKAAAVLQEMGK